MSDFVWFVLIGILFALLCILFLVLGLLIWKKRRMNLIISAHCEKVREEDKKAYCRLFGIGLIVIGIGFGLSGICSVLLQSGLASLPMAVGLAAGIVLLVSAIVRYNR